MYTRVGEPTIYIKSYFTLQYAPQILTYYPRSLIMGSPAKAVRTLTEDEVKELYASAERYVKFKNEYL